MCKFSRIPDVVLGTSIKDPKMKMLCIQLFALANYGEVQEHGHSLSAGQMITTLSVLMERTGLSKKEVRTRLDKLITEGKVTKVGTNHYLILTIVGYDKYFSATGSAAKACTPNGGNGTQKKNVTTTISEGQASSSDKKDTGEARNETSATNSLSTVSNQNGDDNDMQKGTSEVSHIEINKENVVEKSNSTTTDSSFEGRRMWLVDETNAVLRNKGWEVYARTIPEFADAVKKFVAYMGNDMGNGKPRFEKYDNFKVSERLTNWLKNERALKGRINLS